MNSNSLQDIQDTLKSSDEESRLRAVQILRGKPLQTTCGLLFNAMADESWRVRKEAVEIFVSDVPEQSMVAELLELLRNDENAGLRNSAAEAVIRIGAPAAGSLIRLMNDEDVDVRKFVIDVMGAIRAQVFVPSLLTALRDKDVNVAAAAAEHLGNFGDARVVQDLLAAVVANQSDLFRFNALSAIGKLSGPAQIPAEITQLADNELLRKSVYECLGSIADQSAVPLLLEGVKVRQRSSRNAAVMALFRIYSRSGSDSRQAIESALQFFRGSDLVPALIELFDSSEPALAEAIIALLDIIGDRRCVGVLLQAYGDERISRNALRALKHLGSAGIDDLITRFADADPVSRSAICTLIGECSYRNGRDVIYQALHDQSAIVRRSAAAAAGTLGLTDCIPGIVQLLDDSNPGVRSTVVSCLQALALIDRGGIQAVAYQLIDSGQPEQRRNAAILLAALGDGDRLLLLVKDENALVRQAAVSSIGRLHLASASGILIMALVDENPDVRISAAEALADLGGAEVVTALTHALNDEDNWVKCAVLRSLARVNPDGILDAVRMVFQRADGLLLITSLELLDELGGDQAMNLVEMALDNADAEIVSLALAIIGKRSAKRIVPHAVRLLNHHNREVRMACARCIVLLPTVQARELLSCALAQENSDLVRKQLQDLLKGLA